MAAVHVVQRGRARALAAAIAAAALVGAGALVDVAGTSAAVPRTLIATVGPKSTIALRTTAGSKIRRLKVGPYIVVVRDRSRRHNFRLAGPLIPATPTVDRRTRVAFVGTVTWQVRLTAGGYRYFCDEHPSRMDGNFTVDP